MESRPPTRVDVKAGRPLSIALGIYRLHPRGGLEDLCIRIARELVARRHGVTIFTTGAGGDPPPWIEVLPASRFSFTNHGRMNAFAKALRAASRQGFDRTVAFQPAPGADFQILADSLRDDANKPHWKSLTPRFRTYAALERASLANGGRTRLIGLTDRQVQAYVERYRIPLDRVSVLPPVLDPASRRLNRRTKPVRDRVRGELGIGLQTPAWLWIGLQPLTKGLDRVVESLASDPKAHLIVCGLPEDDKKLRPIRRLASSIGVRHRITWAGFVPNSSERFHDIVAAADVLAHPARIDVTGAVILEALVNGLPVVVTEVCGYAEHVLRAESGRVLPAPFDGPAFSRALAEVCGTENARMSRNAIAYGADAHLYSGVSRAADLIEQPFDLPPSWS